MTIGCHFNAMSEVWKSFVTTLGVFSCLAWSAFTAEPPGVIIDKSDDPARVYIGSPSIAVLPDGNYIASHDFFGPGTGFNQSVVFGSGDRGKTWHKLADLDGQWWSTLFVHKGDLCIIGTSREYGNIVIRRSNLKPAKPGEGANRAAIVQVSEDGKRLSHDRDKDMITFPGGAFKFTIRFDPKTQRYWSLVNDQPDADTLRNILALSSSADLRNWKVESILFRHADSKNHAWQYVDWLFEGDDIIAVSRTAWDGSPNYHDANFMTFHRSKNFRALTMADAPVFSGK